MNLEFLKLVTTVKIVSRKSFSSGATLEILSI